MKLPDSLLENYEVGEKIGAGGMGAIFKAYHRSLDRHAAIKVLSSPVFDEHDSLIRFEEEARVCSRMNHPNVVQVFDFDVSTRPAYIVFELIDGKNLKQLIKKKTVMPLGHILDMMTQVFMGLFHAHKQGIIHRDLKPANILIDKDGVPKIADFGLAKMGGVTSNKTKAGMVLGTPLYMSPEQAAERKLTTASDIYSMGVILFELLGGAVPLDGPNDMQILLAHLKEAPPLVSDFNGDIPPELDRIVDMLLQKDPAKRPDNAKAVAASLQKAKRALAPTIKGSMKVTLGRLRGKPRPKVPDRSKATTKRSAAMMTDVASAIMERTSTTVLSHGRKVALLACALIPLIIVIAYLYSLTASQPKEYVVTGLEVSIKGTKRALVQWRGNWRNERPKFKVTSGGRHLAVKPGKVSIKVNHDDRDKAFIHTVLVDGLRSGARHSLLLGKPNGTETLSRTFDTMRAEPFRAQPNVSVTTDGELEVAIEARIPFQCKFVPLGRRNSSELEYGLIHRARYNRSLLDENKDIAIDVTSIDGDNSSQNIKLKDAMAQEFSRVWELFEKDYRKGEFFRYFIKGRRMNSLYHEYSVHYTKNANSDDDKRKVLREFWNKTVKELHFKAPWYRKLEHQLGGLPWMSRYWKQNPPLALAAAKALVPLQLINGAALWYNLDENENWKKVLSNDNHPFPLNYTTSSVRADVEKEFEVETIANLIPRPNPTNPNAGSPPLYMIAWSHPSVKRYEDWFKRDYNQDLPEALTKRLGKVSLTDVRLKNFKAAEISIDTRSPWAHLIIVIEFPRTGFIATFREDRAAHRWLQKELLARHTQKMANEMQPRIFSTPSEGDIFGSGMDDKYPDGSLRFHPIPLSALVEGQNPIYIKVYTGPIELTEKFSFFKVKLRLSR